MEPLKAGLTDKSVRILVVDDYPPFRRFVCSALQNQPELQVVGVVSDGLEAVQKAQELEPDLILLDIGLPKLNGIQAAWRIRELSPKSKILFVSASQSVDIIEEALRTGATGYVVKSDAGSELSPAVAAVLQGKRFVSASFKRNDSNRPLNHAGAITDCHEVAFCADDTSLVDGYARFIEPALKTGHAVIVVVTEAHRASLLARLEADGVDVPAAIEQGSYISLDADETLSRLMVHDMPNPVRCAKVVGDLITRAANGVKGEHGRVVVCGEIAPTLLSKGNAEGAIKLEHLWNEITRDHGVHTLCGYVSSPFLSKELFEKISTEHSAVRGQEPSY